MTTLMVLAAVWSWRPWSAYQRARGPPAPLVPSPAVSAARDSIVSLVLAIHADADRPLGFDQGVELSGNG